MESNGAMSSAELETTMKSQTLIAYTRMAFAKSMALKCIVDLGIPEAIIKHGHPMTASDLAAALSLLPAKAPSLARLLRMLVNLGFFSVVDGGEDGERAFALTPAYRTAVLNGGSAVVRAMLQPELITPWIHLDRWFRSDEPTAFRQVNGSHIWEHADKNPDFSSMFNEAMAYDSRMMTGVIVDKLRRVFDDGPSRGVLVDVGGGNGFVARTITEAFPGLKCVVYDLPHVAGSMQSTERVQFVGGNMFDNIPPGDVFFFKRIFHNHDDDKCLKMLRNCKEAMGGRGGGWKVVIIDMVVSLAKKVDGDQESIELQLFYDMLMVTVFGGKERDEGEWRELVVKAGFGGYKIVPLNYLNLSLIELHP